MGFMGPPYTDHPDGTDCFRKMLYCGKYGAIAGAFFSIYDVLLINKPKGYFPTLARIFIVSSPLVASAVTFAAIACASTNIRAKDDRLNYFIAGIAAGSVFGVVNPHYHVRIPIALFTGLFSIFIKDSMIDNWNFYNEEIQESDMCNRTLYVKKRALSE